MTYVQIAETIVDYYLTRRQVGHTTAALRGVIGVRDAFLLVDSERFARSIVEQNNLQGQVITLGSIPDNLRGMSRPLVVEHQALAIILANLLQACVDSNVLEDARNTLGTYGAHSRSATAVMREMITIVEKLREQPQPCYDREDLGEEE